MEITDKPSKKSRAKLRKACGYTEQMPEQCSNCNSFSQQRFATKTNAYQPHGCHYHKFIVKPHAHCEDWEEKAR